MTLHPLHHWHSDPSWQHPDPGVYEEFVQSYTDKRFRHWALLGNQKDKNIQESVIYSKPQRFGGKAWN